MEKYSPANLGINTISKVIQGYNDKNEIKKETKIYKDGKLINYISTIKNPACSSSIQIWFC